MNNKLLRRVLMFGLIVICAAGMLFGVAGRLAVRQVTHDSMAAIKEIAGKAYENSMPADHSEIQQLETKLYKRVALSHVRQKWENICTLTLWGGLAAGVAAIFMSVRGLPMSKTGNQ